jgi:hypothetical protein
MPSAGGQAAWGSMTSCSPEDLRQSRIVTAVVHLAVSGRFGLYWVTERAS